MKSKIEIKTQAQAINEMRDALIEFEQTGEINDTMKSSVTNSLRDIQVRDFALGLTFENNSTELILSFFDYLLLSAKEIETVAINAIRASYLYRLGDTAKAYEALDSASKADPAYLTELCKAFKRAMTIAADLFGNQAFRKITGNRRQPVSKALFEIWAVNLDKLTDREVSRLQERETQLRTKFKALMDDNDFMIAISYSTGDPRRVRYRFKKIEEIIQETLHA
jgi:hypothetical protein